MKFLSKGVSTSVSRSRMTQQLLRRSEESPSSSNYSDDVNKAGKGTFGYRTHHVPNQESAAVESRVTMQSFTERGINKNPLNPGKDRLFVSHVDPESIYFPNQVARVSYVAAVVNPDENGEYIKDLQDGMESLATRLAPSYFPGTVVRAITTQVDGYSPAGKLLTKEEERNQVIAFFCMACSEIAGMSFFSYL